MKKTRQSILFSFIPFIGWLCFYSMLDIYKKNMFICFRVNNKGLPNHWYFLDTDIKSFYYFHGFFSITEKRVWRHLSFLEFPFQDPQNRSFFNNQSHHDFKAMFYFEQSFIININVQKRWLPLNAQANLHRQKCNR